MQSSLKKIVVFDLETGGFDYRFNPITEFAGVAIENETLEIVDEFSIIIKPYLDLTYIDPDPKKEAKVLFKALCKKDEDTKIQTIDYRSEKITLKNLDILEQDIEKFLKETNKAIFTYEEYLAELKGDFGQLIELYFNRAYSHGALEVTNMSIDKLLEEGVSKEEAFNQILDFFRKHTVGNSKPVAAGHNIVKFDNSFMVQLFKDFGQDFYKNINSFIIDTLDWARIKWFEASAFNLGTCANEVGVTHKEAHRALADTLANAKFLIKMLKSLRGEGDQKSKYKRKKYKLNY